MTSRRFGPVQGLAIRVGPIGAADIVDRWGLPVSHLTAEALRHVGEMGSLRAADTLSLCDQWHVDADIDALMRELRAALDRRRSDLALR